jgi:hypothetical protein
LHSMSSQTMWRHTIRVEHTRNHSFELSTEFNHSLPSHRTCRFTFPRGHIWGYFPTLVIHTFTILGNAQSLWLCDEVLQPFARSVMHRPSMCVRGIYATVFLVPWPAKV